MDTLFDVLAWVGAAFVERKTLLEHSVGFHSDALHVVVGVAIQIVAALVTRRTLAHWLPLLTVFVLELANEANDILMNVWPQPAAQLGEGLKDLILTLSLPLLLFALARWRPGMFVRPDPE